MAKPTENLDWATNGTAQEIDEPTAGMRTEGIKSGGSWYRENLNWMFNGLGKWIDFVRDEVRSDTENDARFLLESNNLSDVTSVVTARNNLGLQTMATKNEGIGDTQFRNNTDSDDRYLPTTLAGYTGVNSHHYKQIIGSNLTSNVSSVWQTVGPTGSGADRIWTELDDLPLNTVSVSLRVRATATANNETFIGLRNPTDTVQGLLNLTVASVRAGSISSSTVSSATVLVDSSNTFSWYSAANGSGVLVLTGFTS